MALQKMGATIEVHGTHIHAKASTLQSARITFPMPSVGATQNTLMAASLAKGETHLLNCAQEPEVIDLCSMLRKMGATLEGEGSSEIFIQGKPDLSGCTHTIMPDRIEAGTFLATALSLGGDVTVQGVHYSDLGAFLKACTQAGAQIHCGSPENPFIRLRMQNRPQSVSIQTEPFPGFPTDLQAQFMAAMCTAEGTSVIHETIFENRFMHVKELQKLGAQIELKGNQARVTGIASLRSATMQATDLRASAGLIIAGFKADTDSSLEKIHHLDRGYQNIEANFARLGISLIRANHLQDSPSPHVHQLLHPFLSHPS
jgi:UDP-N-acetylglucosamine 1-carboxyvinyltransferase